MTPDSARSRSAVHRMVCEAETPAEAMFACTDEACGRRVVVGKSRPAFTVVDRGDFSARHVASVGGVAMEEPTLA